MKGFVKTLEAAIGTFVMLGIITTTMGELETGGKPAEVTSLNNQLQEMDAKVIEEAVNERDGSLIEQNLNNVTMDTSASITLWKNRYESTTNTSFAESFEYNENSSNVELLVWGDRQDVSLDFNSEEFYSNSLSYDRFSLPAVNGTNNITFSNPSGTRIAYLLKHGKEFGSQIPDSEDVYVLRRTFKQNAVNSSEVSVYLWD